MKRLTRNLLDRSQQAYLLSIEVFNKPTIKYRIEGFCYFYVNAWELLCKARIIDQSGRIGAIYYPKKRGEEKRTLSLRDALARVIANPGHPVRKNVERIADLRDHATHFLIPEMEAVYAGLFQAGILNYVEYLRAWFGKRVSEQGTPPLLSLVWDTKDLAPNVIERRHGVEARRFMETELMSLRTEEQSVADRRFSITVEYKLVLTKKAGEADITLGAGPGGALVAQVIHVPKDYAITHPHKSTDMVTLIKALLPNDTKFTSRSFQAVVYAEKLKKADSEYHYFFKQTGTHCYSDTLVNYIEEKIEADPSYLDRALTKYKAHLKSIARPRKKRR